MRFEELNSIYLETIYPIKNNILTVYAKDKNKDYVYDFNLNKFENIPAVYKNVTIFYSAKNKDPNHVLNQLNKRIEKEYSHNDLLTISKRLIDYYLKNKNNFHFNQSFLVQSKSYPEFQLPIQITENHIDTFEKIELNEKYENIFNSKYFCFIYTVLLTDMISVNENDQQIIVESSNLKKVIIE